MLTENDNVAHFTHLFHREASTSSGGMDGADYLPAAESRTAALPTAPQLNLLPLWGAFPLGNSKLASIIEYGRASHRYVFVALRALRGTYKAAVLDGGTGFLKVGYAAQVRNSIYTRNHCPPEAYRTT